VKIISAAGHSFDEDRIPQEAWILDAGCRDYEFASFMEDRGHHVVTIDADASITPDLPMALVGEGKPEFARYIAAQEAGRVIFEENHTLQEVPTITIRKLADKFGVRFDLVKMDIEGSEYDVLLTWPGPVATQISVEFHEPTGQGTAKHGAGVYDRIIKHLGQWYDLVKHDPTPFPDGVNYYDSLWVLRAS